jgi:N-carbamoylputrescine amidase
MTQRSSELITVAAVQMSCVDSADANLAKALSHLKAAAEAGAHFVCLQELFGMRYPCQTEDHDRFADAEPIPGPTTQALADSAKQYGVTVIGSLFERRDAGVYHNSAVVIDADGSFRGMYRKMHIPDDPLYYEKFYFTPGDLGFQCFRTAKAKLGVGICWDQWFPEAARLTAMEGAQILSYPTAIGWLPDEIETVGPSQHSAWETMLRSHAIANGVFVVAPNRVGTEGPLKFWGASLIIDPYGGVLARGSHDEEEVVIAKCDLSLINTARTHWPFMRDRRIDAYQGMLKRWGDVPRKNDG